MCGIATFMHDLMQAVATACPKTEYFACAMNDQLITYDYPDDVRLEIEEADLASYHSAARYLNTHQVDLLCIQHEFGIFGGPAGKHLLTLLDDLTMPVVTTFHTVLQNPNADQRAVTTALIERSSRVVVMAQKGLQILQETYQIDPKKVDIIPHGIPHIPFITSEHFKQPFGVSGRPVLLTFGLLTPGKGIEYAIRALPQIAQQHPDVVYLILGATHPNLVAHEGEVYRESLEKLVAELGVQDNVKFFNQFVSDGELQTFIGATDIYITPYLNEAQITSGTLADVFGSGKAVVSTPYWHAQELLANDHGTLVPFRDPDAIAAAVLRYLGNPTLFQSTREKAYQLGRQMVWPVVARSYLATFAEAFANRGHSRPAFPATAPNPQPVVMDTPNLRLDHIERMTSDVGIYQHAIHSVPNYHEGYCTDDNARALILCVTLENNDQAIAQSVSRLFPIYLAFLAAAWNKDLNRFRNFMTHTHEWTEAVGSEDSQGRAIWALGVGMAGAPLEGYRRLCETLFEAAVSVAPDFASPRAWAFALLGIDAALSVRKTDPRLLELAQSLTQKLLQRWKDASTDTWQWFEENVTYENARLCQALIQIGPKIQNEAAIGLGLRSLKWLTEVQKSPSGHFRPIGSNGFYSKGGTPAVFDQQPVEAQASISACLAAFTLTQDEQWRSEAQLILSWFLGHNDLNTPLYDPTTGGCSDGLHAIGVSLNQGAESTLALHLSLAEINHLDVVSVHKKEPCNESPSPESPKNRVTPTNRAGHFAIFCTQ